MAKRIFVGNLARDTEDRMLNEAFAQYGRVLRAEVVRGRSGRSRGFGYVELESDEDADRAIAALNGDDLLGRTITVAEARARRQRTPMEEAESEHRFRYGHGNRR